MILAPRHIPKLAATIGLFTCYGLLDFAKKSRSEAQVLARPMRPRFVTGATVPVGIAA